MKILLSAAFAAILMSCSAQTRTDGRTFKNVSNDEAHQLMTTTPNLQIVDVRQKTELAQGMIKGAVHMDISKPSFESEIQKLDKTAPVMVYCAAGGRSRTAMEIMEEKGFQVVYNLSGGYEGWK